MSAKKEEAFVTKDHDETVLALTTSSHPENRAYGRLIAACGQSFGGFVEDEIRRGTEPADVVIAVTAWLASLLASTVVWTGGSDAEVDKHTIHLCVEAVQKRALELVRKGATP